MKLHKIKPGSSITIRAKKGDKGGSFSQKSINIGSEDMAYINRQIKVSNNIIVLDAIRHNKRIINFSAPEVSYSCVAVSDKVPYRWRNVRVVNLSLPKAGPVVLIEAFAEGGRYERRENHRAIVNVAGHMMNSVKRTDDKILIKDISLGGIGIIVDGNNRSQVGDSFTIEYKDAYHIDQHISEIANLNFDATVVRRVKMTDGRVLLGCTISQYNARTMRAYINSKEKKLA